MTRDDAIAAATAEVLGSEGRLMEPQVHMIHCLLNGQQVYGGGRGFGRTTARKVAVRAAQLCAARGE